MPATLIAQALALATASGVSIYATVAVLGAATRLGWIDTLPAGLQGVASWWVIALAATLYALEFLATLVPGIASAWEAGHSFLRPVAGAALAAATVWDGSPTLPLVAGLLGGTLALGSQATKLGARVAIDASPEPVTNGLANVAELGYIGTIALLVWQHPYITLTIALLVVVAIALAVRAVWRAVRRAAGGLRRDATG